MNDCKHPAEFVSDLGNIRVCAVCGAHLPKEDKKPAKKEAEPAPSKEAEDKPKKKTKK